MLGWRRLVKERDYSSKRVRVSLKLEDVESDMKDQIQNIRYQMDRNQFSNYERASIVKLTDAELLIPAAQSSGR